MVYRVLVPQPVVEEAYDYLRDRGYEIVGDHDMTEAEMALAARDCEAILLRTLSVTGEILKKAGRMQVVARHGAGYDNIDCETAEDLGIWVTNSPYSTGSSVAEFTIGAMITAAKRLEPVAKAFRGGDFGYKNSHKGLDLEGKTLGIIGFGQIGRTVARKAALGLDMKILAYVPRPEGKEIPEYVKVADWETVWRQSDFITVHVPGGAGNKGLIGEKEFRMMNSHAYLINASRGGVVKEADLLAALSQKCLAGAAVDVFEEEPPGPDHPLLRMENVFVTPHMASNTEECMVRMAMDAAGEIHRVLSGEPPLYPVNHPVPARNTAGKVQHGT